MNIDYIYSKFSSKAHPAITKELLLSNYNKDNKYGKLLEFNDLPTVSIPMAEFFIYYDRLEKIKLAESCIFDDEDRWQLRIERSAYAIKILKEHNWPVDNTFLDIEVANSVLRRDDTVIAHHQYLYLLDSASPYIKRTKYVPNYISRFLTATCNARQEEHLIGTIIKLPDGREFKLTHKSLAGDPRLWHIGSGNNVADFYIYDDAIDNVHDRTIGVDYKTTPIFLAKNIEEYKPKNFYEAKYILTYLLADGKYYVVDISTGEYVEQPNLTVAENFIPPETADNVPNVLSELNRFKY